MEPAQGQESARREAPIVGVAVTNDASVVK